MSSSDNPTPSEKAHRATGKWKHQSVPHRGWICQGMDDLGEGTFQTCEMCEVQEIRYVHTMVHAEYGQSLEVGCICAGHMEEDYGGAVKRERDLRNAVKRAKSAREREAEAQRLEHQRTYDPRPSWLTSQNGNPYAKYGRYCAIVFTQRNGKYGYNLVNDAVKLATEFNIRSLDETKVAAWRRLMDIVKDR